MICTKYDELPHHEKVDYIGSLCHAAQSDNDLFERCLDIIRIAKLRGLFKDVEINPPISTDIKQD